MKKTLNPQQKTYPVQPLPLAHAMRAETQAKDAEMARLRAEVERLRERLGTRACDWCGEPKTVMDSEGYWLPQAIAEAQQHEQACFKNPLVQEVSRLTAALDAETRAVERLAERLAAVEAEVSKACPTGGVDCAPETTCAACWAAWARQKEVPRG